MSLQSMLLCSLCMCFSLNSEAQPVTLDSKNFGSLIPDFVFLKKKKLPNRATWYWFPCWGKRLHGMLKFLAVKIPSARMKVYVKFLIYLHWEALNLLTSEVQHINLIGVCLPHNWRAPLRRSQLKRLEFVRQWFIWTYAFWDPLLW